MPKIRNKLYTSPMSGKNKPSFLKQRIAQEAARILSEHGDDNYRAACNKAADRLGVTDKRHYPNNLDIENALKEYQRLFRGNSQSQALQQLRQLAFEAMESLHRFQPHLVGPVLEGTADRNSGIKLHLFADTPEDVVLALVDLRISWRDGETKMRYRGGETRYYPVFRFHAGDNLVELIVFPVIGLRHPPLSSVNDQPQQRASLKEVKALLMER